MSGLSLNVDAVAALAVQIKIARERLSSETAEPVTAEECVSEACDIYVETMGRVPQLQQRCNEAIRRGATQNGPSIFPVVLTPG